MKRLLVRHSRGTYPVIIGPSTIEKLPGLFKSSRNNRAVIISDSALKKSRLRLKRTLRRAGWSFVEFPVKAGENFKDISSLLPLYKKFVKAKINRKSVLFALGGGSVGDAAGFVASSYLRGISWVGLPTTLLAQVDSSLGGKTGINIDQSGKNLIGAFHQPAAVLCDVSSLKSLSRREMISGFGEAIKYGFIYDPKFLNYLEAHYSELLKHNARSLEEVVYKSLKWKALAVSKDERDEKGIREVLNFGHTFGHALETATRYKKYQHGEAVIWGMRFALALSHVRGHLKKDSYVDLDLILKSVPVPRLPSVKASVFFRLMASDKKSRNGKIHFVLLKKPGRTVSDNGVSLKDLNRAYDIMRSRR